MTGIRFPNIAERRRDGHENETENQRGEQIH